MMALLTRCTALLGSLLLLSYHSTFTSAQSLTFTQITASAPWDVRSEAQLAFHPTPLSYYPPASTTATTSASNSFILFGGRGLGPQYDNDVWLYDGQSQWSLISGTNQFTNVSASSASGPTQYFMRAGSALCSDSTGSRLYMVSGFTKPNYYDYSTDGGVSWTHVNDSSIPFHQRSFPTCSVDPHSGTVYFMGGLDRIESGDVDPKYNDVWSFNPTTSTWTEATDAAAWAARNALSSAATYNAALRVTLLYMAAGLTNAEAGYAFQSPYDIGSGDVWVSSDGGADWTELNSDAFPLRELSRMAVSASGVIVVAEGAVNITRSPYPHDVWASADGGVTWGQCLNNATAPYGARRNHAMAFDQQGYLWLMGGECYGVACPDGGVKYNDVWKSGISFDDLAAVSSACGVTVSPCGAGARCWPIDGPCPCTVPSSTAPASVPSSSSTAGSVVVTPTSAFTPTSAATSAQSPSSTAAASPTTAPSSTNTVSVPSSAATSAANAPSSAATSTSAIAATSASTAAGTVTVPTATSSSSGVGPVVLPPGATTSSSSTGAVGAPDPTAGSSTSGGGGLSTGAIVGIVVAIIVAALLACVLWYMCSRRGKSRSGSPMWGAKGTTGRAVPQAADDTDSSESSNDMLGPGRPLDQVVQIWGTGELELNGSKQQQPSTSSQLGRTSSVSGRSDISGTAESIESHPSMSAVYVHE